MNLNIHGITKIELNNVPKEFKDYMRQRYSLFIEDYMSHPDIKINFVDKLELKNCEYLGDVAAYDANNFYLFDHKRNKVNILFDEARDNFNVSCEKAFDTTTLCISILEELLEYLLIRNNATFIHASCVFYKGQCIILHGWRGGGKTSTLLNFLMNGAEYMSDDVVIISKQGNAFPFTTGINLTEFNFREFPELRKARRIRFSLELCIKKMLSRLYRLSACIPLSTIKKVGDDINKINTYYLVIANNVSFKKLFPQGKIRKSSSINRIYFLSRSEIGNIVVSDIDKESAVAKLFHCREYERLDRTRFHSYFNLFSFASGKKDNPFERIRDKKREILTEALDGKKLYYIQIPVRMNSKKVFKFLASLT